VNQGVLKVNELSMPQGRELASMLALDNLDAFFANSLEPATVGDSSGN